MPNFTIRRRKRAQPEPKEETPSDVEEKVDETEMSDSSDEQAYLDKAIEDLKKVTINDSAETIPPQPGVRLIRKIHQDLSVGIQEMTNIGLNIDNRIG